MKCQARFSLSDVSAAPAVKRLRNIGHIQFKSRGNCYAFICKDGNRIFQGTSQQRPSSGNTSPFRALLRRTLNLNWCYSLHSGQDGKLSLDAAVQHRSMETCWTADFASYSDLLVAVDCLTTCCRSAFPAAGLQIDRCRFNVSLDTGQPGQCSTAAKRNHSGRRLARFADNWRRDRPFMTIPSASSRQRHAPLAFIADGVLTTTTTLPCGYSFIGQWRHVVLSGSPCISTALISVSGCSPPADNLLKWPPIHCRRHQSCSVCTDMAAVAALSPLTGGIDWHQRQAPDRGLPLRHKPTVARQMKQRLRFVHQ